MSCVQAEQTLQGSPYNFQVTPTNQYSTDGVAQNNAISTSPGANATATIGQMVTLTCSLGPSPQSTTPSATASTTPTATDTNSGGGIIGNIGGLGGNGNGN
jgi:beta-lactam-binding protein with PASTA domain